MKKEVKLFILPKEVNLHDESHIHSYKFMLKIKIEATIDLQA